MYYKSKMTSNSTAKVGRGGSHTVEFALLMWPSFETTSVWILDCLHWKQCLCFCMWAGHHTKSTDTLSVYSHLPPSLPHYLPRCDWLLNHPASGRTSDLPCSISLLHTFRSSSSIYAETMLPFSLPTSCHTLPARRHGLGILGLVGTYLLISLDLSP